MRTLLIALLLVACVAQAAPFTEAQLIALADALETARIAETGVPRGLGECRWYVDLLALPATERRTKVRAAIASRRKALQDAKTGVAAAEASRAQALTEHLSTLQSAETALP